MSRIFEMLYKSKGEVADTVRPVVEMETGLPEAAVAAAAQPQEEAPPAAAPLFPQIRTWNVRIAAPSPLLPFEEWRPSEQYRILRTKISHHPRQPRMIVISSPASGEGKTVTAINAAGTLALKSEGKVLLLDTDLRRSAIHTQLGLPLSPGLTEVLMGASSLEEALVNVAELPNLYVLPGGKRQANPAELLDSAQWRSLAAKLRELFQYVISDSPPVGAVADYDLIQAVCDGVILVVRPDHTNRHLCQKALEIIPKNKFLVVLLNCVPDWSPSKYVGSDYYYSSEKELAASDGGAA